MVNDERATSISHPKEDPSVSIIDNKEHRVDESKQHAGPLSFLSAATSAHASSSTKQKFTGGASSGP
jgi:hypothetical protein